MSAPVDVLAVMDRAIENLQDAGVIGNTIGMCEARAAVAELVAATVMLVEACEESQDFAIAADSESDALRMAHNALARVGGGK